jgi:hypothetical protein
VNPDELAAREERVNEAALEAEEIYHFILDADEEDVLAYLRSLLRMRAEVSEVLKATATLKTRR